METKTAEPATRVRAAQYLRMSTDRQDYSIEFQAAANLQYGQEKGYELVASYSDVGISGLSIDRRTGLKSLLADVVSGAAGFSVVLTYDVSRWGRFQDADESAHYEFLCRSAGVAVEYVAEPHVNDGSITAAILKSVKRVMAAEYSRDLSSKVRWGQQNAAARGFWVGGPPSYGYHRQLVKRGGQRGALLGPGDRKVLAGYRVILVRGAPIEVETVRDIFRMFVKEDLKFAEIARVLNLRQSPGPAGGEWSHRSVQRVLSNVAYVGDAVSGRRVYELGGRRPRKQPEDQWRVVRGAHDALVGRRLFRAAAEKMQARTRSWTNEEMLDGLRQLLRRRGRLSGSLIDAAADLPSQWTYASRFGGLCRAYEAIDYTPDPKAAAAARRSRERVGRAPLPSPSDRELLIELRSLLRRHGSLSQHILVAQFGRARADWIRNRFGGYARLYRLAGYQPTDRQRAAISPRPSRSPCACEVIFGRPSGRRWEEVLG